MRTATSPTLAFLFACSLLVLSIFCAVAQAQTNPIQLDTQVTAIVSDLIPPSTPILIDPTNGEKLKTGDVDFIWKGSTDNWLMDHYTFVLNDTEVYDDIPLTATTSAQYVLTYDSLTDQYTLDPTNNLADGNYTWKIIAWDYHGNQTSSVVWSFSIDTQAPVFIITEIEDKTVEITTQDADSVPDDPIELEANNPTLSGTGEANSSVHLTIRYENGDQEEMNFTIDGNGNWEIELEDLQRDQEILLDFLITDPSGNVSILTDVPLILYTPVVEIPVPPFVPTIPGIIKPPAVEPPPVEVEPPVIEIPILPPEEYIPAPVRKKVVYFVRNSLVTVKEDVITGSARLLHIVLLLVLLALPLGKLATLQIMYRHYSSGQLFKEFLWLIGWWHKKNPQGIVVERESQLPVPHALVLISGKDAQKRNISATLITNNEGIFPYFPLPEGEYRISIHHPRYFFPSMAKANSFLQWNSHYIGAPFMVKNGSTLLPLAVPVELAKQQGFAWFYQARKAFLLAPSVSWIFVIISIVICMAFPSLVNWTTLTVYGFLLLTKWVTATQKRLQVEVETPSKQHLDRVIIGFQKEGATQLAAITQTKEGQAVANIQRGQHIVWAIDFSHRLTEGDHRSATTFKVESAQDYLPLVMEAVK